MSEIIHKEENPSPDYLKGFNYGYMIAENIPDLAKQLATATGASDRFVGMKHGIEQYKLEQSKTKLPDWLQQDRLQTLDTKDMNKGKEGIEKD